MCLPEATKFLCPGEGTAVVYLRGTERQHVIADESAAVFQGVPLTVTRALSFAPASPDSVALRALISSVLPLLIPVLVRSVAVTFRPFPDGTGITECPGFHRGIAPGNQCPAVVQAAGTDSECFPGNAAAFLSVVSSVVVRVTFSVAFTVRKSGSGAVH